VFNTPQNVQTGTVIVISWTFGGTQSTHVELGIMDSQTSAITVIDTNVDLTKRSEKLDCFSTPTTPTQVNNVLPNVPSQSTQSNISSAESSIDDMKKKLYIAAPIVILIIIGVLIGFYIRRRSRDKMENVNVIY
ncbi:9635_t:CDS:2, partial [Dentiscutata erythropus]